MNLDLRQIKRFFSNFDISDIQTEKLNLIICPPIVFFEYVGQAIGDRPIEIGAQNIFWEEEGPYTGEISAHQLADAGCKYVIIGHSERRQLFNEDDALVNKKVKIALKNRLVPIVCLGENLEEKETGLTKKVIEQKIKKCFSDVRSFEMKKVIIAYEPMWAISTSQENPSGQADSPEGAQVVHKLIRRVVENMFDPYTAKAVTIIYGGSVDAENVGGFAAMEDIQGVLVGSASRQPESFKKIIIPFINK